MKPLRVALRVVSFELANALPTENVRGKTEWATFRSSERRWPRLVGRTSWLPTKDTYQRRRQYRNEEASVEYVPDMSRKACERSWNRPNQGNLARHVEAFRYQSGSNPLECVMCVAVAPPHVVEGV